MNCSSTQIAMIFYFLSFTLLLLPLAEAFVPRPISSTVRSDSVILETSTRSKERANHLLPQPAFPLNPLKLRLTTTATTLHLSTSSNSGSRPTKIIIAGAPASGKGTQCEKITAKYGVVHLSTGDMLRAAVAAGTEVGREAKAYMDAGKLVPDSTIIGVVKDRLDQDDCRTQGWLLDGFPRTREQALALERAGITADCFIFLSVPDEVLVERVVGRRTDPVTGKIYHMTFSPPEDDEVRARLQQRSDDTEEKVKVRLEQFHANVEAVKGSFADISVTIDGNQDPARVSELIFEAIGSLVTA